MVEDPHATNEPLTHNHTTTQQHIYCFYSALGAVHMRVGSQRFTQNAHSLQIIVIMASTFNGIELEDGNAAVAFKQTIKSRDAVKHSALRPITMYGSLIYRLPMVHAEGTVHRI
jgi:hypothetical protein